MDPLHKYNPQLQLQCSSGLQGLTTNFKFGSKLPFMSKLYSTATNITIAVSVLCQTSVSLNCCNVILSFHHKGMKSYGHHDDSKGRRIHSTIYLVMSRVRRKRVQYLEFNLHAKGHSQYDMHPRCAR